MCMCACVCVCVCARVCACMCVCVCTCVWWSLLGMHVDTPAQHLTVKATGEEVARGALLRPAGSTHHAGVTLHTGVSSSGRDVT